MSRLFKKSRKGKFFKRFTEDLTNKKTEKILKKTVKQATKPVFGFEKPVKKQVKKEIGKVKKATGKTLKFLSKPETIRKIGKGAEVAGEGLVFVGGLSGQPELVAVGTGLTAGGQVLEGIGKTGEKIEKLQKGDDVKTSDIIKEIKVVEQIITGDSVITDTASKVAPTLDKLTQQIKRDRDIIELEEEVIKKEEEIISKEVDVINELGDRLQEALDKPTSFSKVLDQARDLDKSQGMDYIRRNWNIIKDLDEGQRNKIYKELNL